MPLEGDNKPGHVVAKLHSMLAVWAGWASEPMRDEGGAFQLKLRFTVVSSVETCLRAFTMVNLMVNLRYLQKKPMFFTIDSKKIIKYNKVSS